MTDLLIKDSTKKPPMKVKYPAVGQRYAITLNPNPSLYKGSTNPLDQVRASLPKIFKHFKYIGHLSLQIEMTLMGNIHYHGFLFVTDKKKYGITLNSFQKYHCAITLKTCPTPSDWIQYIMKERDQIMDIIEEPDMYDTDPESQYYNYVTGESYSKWDLSYKKRMNIKVSNIMDYIEPKYAPQVLEQLQGHKGSDDDSDIDYL